MSAATQPPPPAERPGGRTRPEAEPGGGSPRRRLAAPPTPLAGQAPESALPAAGGGRATPGPAANGTPDLLLRARDAVSEECDPELPVLTIADLGVLRDVALEDGRVVVAITPTYSGCPAMNTIALEIELALARAGIADATVRTVLHPAWTTDWMSEAGREKLREYGVAPPGRGAGRRALFGQDVVVCPRCGSEDTERLAEFGSTSCKALWRCRSCREPFDYFKCH